METRNPSAVAPLAPSAAGAADPPPPAAKKGVANCNDFKSRLQEFSQKVGIPPPVYQLAKEGPSHEPVYKSTVLVNNVRYDSLPGFLNSNDAEKSAAEVALRKIYEAGKFIEGITTFQEPGMCKNLLHRYAQKMNYSQALYECYQPWGPFTSTVWIGGIKYTGAAARTKKEAEINAARTALLAIKENSKTIGMSSAHQNLTVPPVRKKGQKEKEARDTKVSKPEQQLRVDKASLKRYCSSRRFSRGMVKRVAKLNELGAAADRDKMRKQKAAGDLDKVGSGKTIKNDTSSNCRDARDDGSMMKLEVESLEGSQEGKIMGDMVKIPWDDYIPL